MISKTPTKLPVKSTDSLVDKKSMQKKKPEIFSFTSYLGKHFTGKKVDGISYLDPEEEISQFVCGESHIFMVSKDSKMFGVGSNNFYQLGQSRTGDVKIPINLLLKEKIGVTSIFAGADYTYAITSKYEVYSWGSNIKGQLGHGHFNDVDSPFKVNALSPRHRTSSMGSIPISDCILNLNEIVADIACGPLHVIVVTTLNRLFAVGYGNTYALGNGKNDTIANFEEITYFSGLGQKIDKICCGVTHSACISSGRVYMWGTAGLQKTLIFKKPNIISIKEDVIDLALGDMNTILLTSKGEVFTLGENIDFQLGYKPNNSNGPSKVNLPNKIEYITCGLNHVIAISKSKIYAWGSNRYGQIKPNSNEKYIEIPEILEWIGEAMPLSITCSYFQTYIISRTRLVLPKTTIHNQQQLTELKKEIESFKNKHEKLKKENEKLTDEVKTLYSTLDNIDKTDDKINQGNEVIRKFKSELRKTRTLAPNYEIDYKELRFGDKLSEGAFGIVYKGMWREIKVAIKTLKPKYLKEETIKDFLSKLIR